MLLLYIFFANKEMKAMLRKTVCHSFSKWQSGERNSGQPFHYAMLFHKIRNWPLTQSFVSKFLLTVIIQSLLITVSWIDLTSSGSAINQPTSWVPFFPVIRSLSWPDPLDLLLFSWSLYIWQELTCGLLSHLAQSRNLTLKFHFVNSFGLI